MKKFFLLIIICLISTCYSESKVELEQKGQDKLEDSFEKMGIGLVEIGVGVYEFSHGDAIGGATAIGAGAKSIKDSTEDFKEAKDFFEKS
jgi:hypothetical protein